MIKKTRLMFVVILITNFVHSVYLHTTPIDLIKNNTSQSYITYANYLVLDTNP